jgi:two-component system NarL family sensor kinase
MPQQEYEIVTGIVVTIIVFLLAGFFIFALVAYINQRKKKHIEEKQMMQSSFQQELLQTQLEIQEQTLKTISQEIHDNIGQVLSLAKLNLNTMDMTKQEELKEKIIDSKNLVSKAIQDLRDLSKSLNTDNIAAMGLLRAVEYELEMIRKAGFETALETTGPIIKMEPQKELIIFRIVQETLNNILKHAEAKKIIIHASYFPDKLELQVTDNGKGVDLSPLNEEEHHDFGLGIRNMHNRAKLIGADFNMSSGLGKGTVVTIVIPFINHNV